MLWLVLKALSGLVCFHQIYTDDAGSVGRSIMISQGYCGQKEGFRIGNCIFPFLFTSELSIDHIWVNGYNSVYYLKPGFNSVVFPFLWTSTFWCSLLCWLEKLSSCHPIIWTSCKIMERKHERQKKIVNLILDSHTTFSDVATQSLSLPQTAQRIVNQ